MDINIGRSSPVVVVAVVVFVLVDDAAVLFRNSSETYGVLFSRA
jgi:hypothetical protein